METQPMIRVHQLCKTFQMGRQNIRALDGVDLEMERNSFTVVMGPSGSGKSTLLYLVGGLDRPTSGSITVDGVVLEKMDENGLAQYRQKKVGFIFQSFNLLASMSAQDNVAFPLCFAGVPVSRRVKLARELLEKVGLETRMQHKPTELSGGQQQRVAIARALVNDPALILADEPTGNLDTASGMAVMKLLSELHLSGRTVLVVTHDPRMLHFATRAIYLLDGCTVSEEEYRAASTSFQYDEYAEKVPSP
jgi:putative ABC transport system ATP-binding protein